AEVDRADVGRPLPDAEERPHGCGIASHHRSARSTDELAVAGDVIAVGMTVRHYKIQRRVTVAGQPGSRERVDDRRDVDPSGAAIEQQRSVASEEEVEEWLLVARARRLTQDVQVGVVGVHAERGSAGAVRAAGVPARGELTCLDRLARLTWVRACDPGTREDERSAR